MSDQLIENQNYEQSGQIYSQFIEREIIDHERQHNQLFQDNDVQEEKQLSQNQNEIPNSVIGLSSGSIAHNDASQYQLLAVRNQILINSFQDNSAVSQNDFNFKKNQICNAELLNQMKITRANNDQGPHDINYDENGDTHQINSQINQSSDFCHFQADAQSNNVAVNPGSESEKKRKINESPKLKNQLDIQEERSKQNKSENSKGSDIANFSEKQHKPFKINNFNNSPNTPQQLLSKQTNLKISTNDKVQTCSQVQEGAQPRRGITIQKEQMHDEQSQGSQIEDLNAKIDIASTKSILELHDQRPSTTEKILEDKDHTLIKRPHDDFNQQMNNTMSDYLREIKNNATFDQVNNDQNTQSQNYCQDDTNKNKSVGAPLKKNNGGSNLESSDKTVIHNEKLIEVIILRNENANHIDGILNYFKTEAKNPSRIQFNQSQDDTQSLQLRSAIIQHQEQVQNQKNVFQHQQNQDLYVDANMIMNDQREQLFKIKQNQFQDIQKDNQQRDLLNFQQHLSPMQKYKLIDQNSNEQALYQKSEYDEDNHKIQTAEKQKMKDLQLENEYLKKQNILVIQEIEKIKSGENEKMQQFQQIEMNLEIQNKELKSQIQIHQENEKENKEKIKNLLGKIQEQNLHMDRRKEQVVEMQEHIVQAYMDRDDEKLKLHQLNQKYQQLISKFQNNNSNIIQQFKTSQQKVKFQLDHYKNYQIKIQQEIQQSLSKYLLNQDLKKNENKDEFNKLSQLQESINQNFGNESRIKEKDEMLKIYDEKIIELDMRYSQDSYLFQKSLSIENPQNMTIAKHSPEHQAEEERLPTQTDSQVIRDDEDTNQSQKVLLVKDIDQNMMENFLDTPFYQKNQDSHEPFTQKQEVNEEQIQEKQQIQSSYYALSLNKQQEKNNENESDKNESEEEESKTFKTITEQPFEEDQVTISCQRDRNLQKSNSDHQNEEQSFIESEDSRQSKETTYNNYQGNDLKNENELSPIDQANEKAIITQQDSNNKNVLTSETAIASNQTAINNKYEQDFSNLKAKFESILKKDDQLFSQIESSKLQFNLQSNSRAQSASISRYDRQGSYFGQTSTEKQIQNNSISRNVYQNDNTANICETPQPFVIEEPNKVQEQIVRSEKVDEQQKGGIKLNFHQATVRTTSANYTLNKQQLPTQMKNDQPDNEKKKNVQIDITQYSYVEEQKSLQIESDNQKINCSIRVPTMSCGTVEIVSEENKISVKQNQETQKENEYEDYQDDKTDELNDNSEKISQADIQVQQQQQLNTLLDLLNHNDKVKESQKEQSDISDEEIENSPPRQSIDTLNASEKKYTSIQMQQLSVANSTHNPLLENEIVQKQRRQSINRRRIGKKRRSKSKASEQQLQSEQVDEEASHHLLTITERTFEESALDIQKCKSFQSYVSALDDEDISISQMLANDVRQIIYNHKNYMHKKNKSIKKPEDFQQQESPDQQNEFDYSNIQNIELNSTIEKNRKDDLQNSIFQKQEFESSSFESQLMKLQKTPLRSKNNIYDQVDFTQPVSTVPLINIGPGTKKKNQISKLVLNQQVQKISKQNNNSKDINDSNVNIQLDQVSSPEKQNNLENFCMSDMDENDNMLRLQETQNLVDNTNILQKDKESTPNESGQIHKEKFQKENSRSLKGKAVEKINVSELNQKKQNFYFQSTNAIEGILGNENESFKSLSLKTYKDQNELILRKSYNSQSSGRMNLNQNNEGQEIEGSFKYLSNEAGEGGSINQTTFQNIPQISSSNHSSSMKHVKSLQSCTYLPTPLQLISIASSQSKDSNKQNYF